MQVLAGRLVGVSKDLRRLAWCRVLLCFYQQSVADGVHMHDNANNEDLFLARCQSWHAIEKREACMGGGGWLVLHPNLEMHF